MPLFSYKAKRQNGEIYEGEKEALDKFILFKEIRSEGGEVVSVKEIRAKSKGGFSLPFLNGVGTQEKINFAKNLSAMIDAGLAVSRALTVMERQSSNKNLKKILASLNSEISQGKTLSDAMLKYPNTFSTLFISMVRAGEESGTLSSSLKMVGLQMEKNYTLTRKVRGAMMYPSVILGVMVIIAILMLTYIVPTLTKTFLELNIKLPFTTRLIIGISDLFINHSLLLLLGLIIIGGAFYVWKRSESGTRFIHIFITKIPIIGELVKEVNTARTARTMSSLLTAGVDIIESVKITTEVIQNVHYKKILVQVEEKIKKGAPISEVFEKNSKLYPVFIGEMVAVGEETGKVGEMLLSVANFYENDVEQRTKDMSTIIEPFLMVFIGGAVGFFALAMISPMYSLADVI